MFTQQRKDRAARIYLERRTKIFEWIKDCFEKNNEPINNHTDDIIELVADGTILCRLINIYFPNSIENIVYPTNKFFYHRIQNISEFIRQCQIIKVPIVFQTLDLFENKNPARVVACLYCLIEMLDDKLAKRRLKRKQEFTLEEMARAHLELEVDGNATDMAPISEYLIESLPSDIINGQPTIQLQVSSSNAYESNNLSILDTSHTRTTVINTPKLLSSAPSPLFTPLASSSTSSGTDIGHDQFDLSMTASTPLATPKSTSTSNGSNNERLFDKNEMSTMTAIKTAAVLTSPVRRSSSSFSSSLLDNHLNHSIMSPFKQNTHNHSSSSSSSTTVASPYKPLYPSLMKLNDINNHQTSNLNIYSNNNNNNNSYNSSSSSSNNHYHSTYNNNNNNSNNNSFKTSTSYQPIVQNTNIKHTKPIIKNKKNNSNQSSIKTILKTLMFIILYLILVMIWMILFVENHDKLNSYRQPQQQQQQQQQILYLLQINNNNFVCAYAYADAESSSERPINQPLLSPITLDYNPKSIPLTPGCTLDSMNESSLSTNRVFSPSLAVSFHLNEYGQIILGYRGFNVFTTPKFAERTDYHLLMKNDSNLCVVASGTDYWCSNSQKLGGRYFTVLQEGAYNRDWGIVILNDDFQMVWGRFGEQRGFRVSLIPGSYLDSKSSNNKLSVGQFITNGRDYFTVTEEGFGAMILGNPFTSGKERRVILTHPVGSTRYRYTLNLENGTLVLYTNDTRYQPFVQKYWVGGGRYLQLPIPRDVDCSSDWAMVSRNELGKVLYGFFNNPLESQDENSYLSESKNGDWDGQRPLRSNFLIAEVWPNVTRERTLRTERRAFCSFNMRCAKYYGYPDVIWSADEFVKADVTIAKIKRSWTYDGRFTVEFQITGFDHRGDYNHTMYMSPLIADRIPPKSSAFVLLSSMPEAVVMECLNFYFVGTIKGCTYRSVDWVTHFITNIIKYDVKKLVSDQESLNLPPKITNNNVKTIFIYFNIMDHYAYIINQPLIAPITLDYNSERIPLTPKCYLDAKSSKNYLNMMEGLTPNQAVDFYFNKNGQIYLWFRGEARYISPKLPIGGNYKLVMKNDSNLCIVSDRTDHWCSNSQGLGGRYFTVLQEGAYNRDWGFVILNEEFQMVWGMFGEQRGFRVSLIPGSYLDAKSKRNHLKVGQFITNGKQTSKTPNSPDFDYILNFEDGTMVLYTNDSSRQPFADRWSVGGGRYLQIPTLRDLSCGDWAIVNRAENGKVIWGYFSHPLNGDKNNFISQEVDNGEWDGKRPFQSNFLISQVWPNTTSQTDERSLKFCSFNIRCNKYYGYPDVIWSADRNIIFNFHIEKMVTSWDYSGSFIVQFNIHFLDALDPYDVLYRSPLVATNTSAKQHAIVLLTSLPEAVVMDCSPTRFSGNIRGCEYRSGISFTTF
ncbi:hypothetical protein PPL_07006 [Heterostelium album PN500]|uniref:Calponin-homology (CH) domain-containing protein n=1 Tax=Heterostelium pallidum (strain ATCC 26659 / Pp 5 / PN500) TaxID=670386 RepID=D3BE53_HETP5|nr:hypothetical protein PPL_07006 [Heterostelium album PN500]EFA80184.1 hypothetical protein PPL_07006 [Heterostelium album PN500]|eukprot:XP_020432304.1 hypothetical protein PPL_07006 [Heterostelium album PN500]